LLRILASQFSAETDKFEGAASDALELIYTTMDLVGEANEAADSAIEQESQKWNQVAEKASSIPAPEQEATSPHC
jgi:hypothetical protein